MEIDIIEQSIQDISPGLLKILLCDKTTKCNIRWGTDNYMMYGPEYYADGEILPELITGEKTMVIQPRISKSVEEQEKRTKGQAEVFTPSWVCNEQNNLVDTAWFGAVDIFNKSENKSWKATEVHVIFPPKKNWKKYVDARRMEVSCGEAPYIVSRYDTVSGNKIPIKERIGFLDRKLRVINENTQDAEEWFKWTIRAFQSCYGYDFSGDNVLLARENLLLTFVEYAEERFGKMPDLKIIKKIANIIAWNIWQMNGLTMTAPHSYEEPKYKQMNILNELESAEERTEENEIPCRIQDWRSKLSLEFRSLIKER